MVGLVTHRGLWKFNRWFVVIAFIIGAILTPSPDVVSQIMMAAPMIVLYNMSILLAWNVTARREKAEAVLREKERLADEEERAAIRAKRKAAGREDEVEDDKREATATTTSSRRLRRYRPAPSRSHGMRRNQT